MVLVHGHASARHESKSRGGVNTGYYWLLSNYWTLSVTCICSIRYGYSNHMEAGWLLEAIVHTKRTVHNLHAALLQAEAFSKSKCKCKCESLLQLTLLSGCGHCGEKHSADATVQNVTVQKSHSAERQCRTVVVQKWEMCLLFLAHA